MTIAQDEPDQGAGKAGAKGGKGGKGAATGGRGRGQYDTGRPALRGYSNPRPAPAAQAAAADGSGGGVIKTFAPVAARATYVKLCTTTLLHSERLQCLWQTRSTVLNHSM